MCPASPSVAPTNRHSGGIAATRSPRCARISGRSSPGSAPPGPGGAASPLPGPGGGSHGTAAARRYLRKWCGSASPFVLASACPPRVGVVSRRTPPTRSPPPPPIIPPPRGGRVPRRRADRLVTEGDRATVLVRRQRADEVQQLLPRGEQVLVEGCGVESVRLHAPPRHPPRPQRSTASCTQRCRRQTSLRSARRAADFGPSPLITRLNSSQSGSV